MIADSTRKLASTLRGWKPSVSSTAISGARDETAAYIVFTAPNTAPTAMIARDHDREDAEDAAEQLRLLGVERRLAVARRP